MNIQFLQTSINNKLRKFDSFSSAFRQAVDNTGRDHVDFYGKIDMDKSQWSKIYHGETKNPQPSTRKKLTDVVGVDIRKVGEKWIIVDDPRAAQAIDSVNRVRDEAALYRGKEPALDDLPELIRLRDMLDEKIRKLVNRKSDD